MAGDRGTFSARRGGGVKCGGAAGFEHHASGPGPRLLSAQTAAKYLGVPYTTLRDWALRGHLPVIRAPQSRRMWFDRKDLDRIVDQWKERA